MIEVTNKIDCCGCSACANVCPKNCIEMISDNEGFLYPKVDKEKCVNCGMCKKTCNSINNLTDDCINCGQCILTCPSGSLVPKYDYKKVLNYINDTDYVVVAFTAPAVRVAIGDEFGFPEGTFLEGKMVSALRNIGFNYVFDTINHIL